MGAESTSRREARDRGPAAVWSSEANSSRGSAAAHGGGGSLSLPDFAPERIRTAAVELATRVLGYFSPPLPPESDASFERARSERLRRRIRVYCVVMGLMALLTAFVKWGNDQTWGMLAGLADVSLSAAVFYWTRPKAVVDRLRLAQVTMTLIALTATLGLVGARLDGGPPPLGLFPLLWRHVLAAAILPWNWREAVFAFGLMWVANTGAVTLDWLWGRTDVLAWLLVVLAGPTLAAPGTLLSWWRHSQYRRRYQLVTESEMYRSLSRELESARRVHEAFLPAPIRHNDLQLSYVYQPHRQLGGDVLYVHPPRPRPGEAFTLILLDVVGHGIAAALTVNRLLGEIERMFAEAEAGEPGSVVTPTTLAVGLNRYVGLTLAGHGLFATAFIARVDVAGDRLTWVNCGHPPGFLVSPGREVVRLEGGAMMLGVVDESQLGASDTHEPFPPGSVLVVCTDGATEARDASGAPLLVQGVQRLLAAQIASGEPPTEWPARLAAAIAEYRDGSSDDDLLLATVARVPAAATGPAATPPALSSPTT